MTLLVSAPILHVSSSVDGGRFCDWKRITPLAASTVGSAAVAAAFVYQTSCVNDVLMQMCVPPFG
jgi:hypothetical protein